MVFKKVKRMDVVKKFPKDADLKLLIKSNNIFTIGTNLVKKKSDLAEFEARFYACVDSGALS